MMNFFPFHDLFFGRQGMKKEPNWNENKYKTQQAISCLCLKPKTKSIK
jgi:hypothetical protein